MPAPLVKPPSPKPGEQVEVMARGRDLVVRPWARRARKHHALDDLLAQCNFSQGLSKPEREWLGAPCVGREEI